jgi:hypothetical protein
MVEVDTEVTLRIEHTDSVTVILVPLRGEPTKAWRRHFEALRRPQQDDVVDIDGSAWIRVLFQQSEIDGSDAAVERLEEVVQLVASANLREAENRSQWADFDDRLRSWWSNKSRE